jgi:hypothetical protein
MTRSNLLPAALTVALLTACGPTQVVVIAEISSANSGADLTPLGDLEIRLFPYDRDLIFDSLTAISETPEPAIPDSVLDAQNQVAAAQQEWRDLEARWNVLRDTLRVLSSELEQLSRGQPRYRILFLDFEDLDEEYAGVERRRDAAFTSFTDLQAASLTAAQETRLRREQWANEAFRDVDGVMLAHQRASGLAVLYDTTDASGIADGFEAKAGDYWVTARYELSYTELYWNILITVVRGEPEQVRLTRDNATSRPKL